MVNKHKSLKLLARVVKAASSVLRQKQQYPSVHINTGVVRYIVIDDSNVDRGKEESLKSSFQLVK